MQVAACGSSEDPSSDFHHVLEEARFWYAVRHPRDRAGGMSGSLCVGGHPTVKHGEGKGGASVGRRLPR